MYRAYPCEVCWIFFLLAESPLIFTLSQVNHFIWTVTSKRGLEILKWVNIDAMCLRIVLFLLAQCVSLYGVPCCLGKEGMWELHCLEAAGEYCLSTLCWGESCHGWFFFLARVNAVSENICDSPGFWYQWIKHFLKHSYWTVFFCFQLRKLKVPASLWYCCGSPEDRLTVSQWVSTWALQFTFLLLRVCGTSRKSYCIEYHHNTDYKSVFSSLEESKEEI